MKNTLLLLFILSSFSAFTQEQGTLDYKVTYDIGEKEMIVYLDKTGQFFYMDQFPEEMDIDGISIQKIVLNTATKAVILEAAMNAFSLYIETDLNDIRKFAGPFYIPLLNDEENLHMNIVKRERSHDHGTINCTEYSLYPDGQEEDPIFVCLDESVMFDINPAFSNLMNILDPDLVMDNTLPKGLITGFITPDGEMPFKLKNIEQVQKNIHYSLFIKASDQ